LQTHLGDLVLPHRGTRASPVLFDTDPRRRGAIVPIGTLGRGNVVSTTPSFRRSRLFIERGIILIHRLPRQYDDIWGGGEKGEGERGAPTAGQRRASRASHGTSSRDRRFPLPPIGRGLKGEKGNEGRGGCCCCCCVAAAESFVPWDVARCDYIMARPLARICERERVVVHAHAVTLHKICALRLGAENKLVAVIRHVRSATTGTVVI